MEITLRGIAVSPGVSIGPAYPFQVKFFDVPCRDISDVAAEKERLTAAFEQAREDLIQLREQTRDELGDRQAAIFHSHLDMLDDVAFKPEIERRIEEEKIGAESLVNDLITSYTRMMEQIEDPLFRERSMDFVDIGRRVLQNLLELEQESLEHLEKPSVVIAHDLTPSETTNMDMPNTLGIATDEGGPTSHMAILARAFEIPCVVGLRYLTRQVSPDDQIIVDGSNGYVIIRPDKVTLAYYEKEKQRLEADRLAFVESAVEGPCMTQDGQEIHTYANIELLAETKHSIELHCQGVGLYRTEFLFMNRATLPGEDEQFHSYRRIVETMAPLPVTMRTLDAGGDKVIPNLNREVELNPQLGWRSIRLSLDRPDIFKAQLRAMLRASVFGKVQIMFPMITGIDQYNESMQVVREVQDDLIARGVEFDPDVKFGSMIEVPAAVMIADKLAEVCDFFSIGTNDLIQYCLAVDRVNPRTAALYQSTHMAVLRMIKQTVDAARKADIPCTICGEMGGDPVLAELLIGMGITSLSMSSVNLPMVRAEIANTRMPTAKRLAKKILDMGSVSAITSFLEERHMNRDTLHLMRNKSDNTRDQ
ncbi:MAG: phosphoenolpyruvate--protein phosphotransferase [Candidatus Hydrogenedentota bacterium]